MDARTPSSETQGSARAKGAGQSVEASSVDEPLAVAPSIQETPVVLLDSRSATQVVRRANIVMGDGVRMFPGPYAKVFAGNHQAGVCQRGKRVPWVIAEVSGSFLHAGADEEIVLVGEYDCARYGVYESLSFLVRREQSVVTRAPWPAAAYLLGSARTTTRQLDELLVNWGHWCCDDGNLGMLFWDGATFHEAFRTTWATRYGCHETPPVTTQGVLVRAYLGARIPRFEEELWLAECRADERSPFRHEYHLAETRALEVTEAFREYALAEDPTVNSGGEDGS